MCCAGTFAFVGTVFFRVAEGIKFRTVKSGELYKRAHVLSKRIGIRLDRVSVVPFGRGRLTNGYGGRNQVALTDDYGHWLHGPELDFVIAHELSHCKQKHGIKKLSATTGLFAFSAAIAAWAPRPAFGTVVLNFCAILLPLMASDALSRGFEYAADRGAVELTGEPDAGVKSLTDMYRHTEVPAQSSRFQELFSTHPVLSRRLNKIRRAAHARSSAR
jgi:Zn-dependent protease with chaperone function